MIINLTPHPLHIFPAQTPDRIASGSVEPLRVIPPSQDYPPARLGQVVLRTDFIDDMIPVDQVAFGPSTGQVSQLPASVPGTWYVVSLVVGLAATHRTDLLVPHEYVRDLDGSIIGSRRLARPSRQAPVIEAAETNLSRLPVAA
ncbi:hypothetical protein GCM10023322_79170 [Rugosimonospora acidiphila]|uniref:Uncharacterized protein n=1 Tax=Rugosimonospora acidiphila TaxID=556531 RepID=A0ABP9SRP7_9ACTN